MVLSIRLEKYHTLIYLGHVDVDVSRMAEHRLSQSIQHEDDQNGIARRVRRVSAILHRGNRQYFYAPPNSFVLEEYAQHRPSGFKCVSKVWDEFSAPIGQAETRRQESEENNLCCRGCDLEEEKRGNDLRLTKLRVLKILLRKLGFGRMASWCAKFFIYAFQRASFFQARAIIVFARRARP